MLIDKSHRIWIVLTVLATAVATTLYVVYARNAPAGPQGGSWPGLAFGVVGSALMVFAGLLAGRKKVPRWRLGTARFWLKAHLWLGLLSVPMILFHAGFQIGGLLEQILLIVFATVILSGLVGVAFQQYLPRHIKETSPQEAMFEQIPHVCQALRERADARVAAVRGTLFAIDENEPTTGPAQPGTEAEFEPLRAFYVDVVRPYLTDHGPTDSPLANPSRAESLFSQARQSLSGDDQGVLNQLAAICDERRTLARQAHLHRWLHLWLFVHIPLSLSLLVLGVVHAVMSVYY